MALLGMQPVLVAIGHVVEQVHGARQPAEDREGGQGRPHGGREETLGEDEPAEHEQVLDPLLRPQRDEDGAEHAGGYRRITFDGWGEMAPVALRVSMTRRAPRATAAQS